MRPRILLVALTLVTALSLVALIGAIDAPRRVAGFGDALPASAGWRTFMPEDCASLDFGVAGETSWEGVPRLQRLLPALDADVVVLAWGAHDVQAPGWTPQRSLAAFAAGVDAVQARGLEPVIVVPPPLFEEGGLPHAVLNERLTLLRQGLRALGERRHVALVDLFASHWIEGEAGSLMASLR